MNKIYSLTLLLLLIAFTSVAQYVTVWKTDNEGVSENNQIIIPATGLNYTISWEEQSNPANKGTAVGNNNHTLTFPAPGVYKVSITTGSGSFTSIAFQNGNDRKKLLEISNWGGIRWKSMESAYHGCENLKITATDIPNLQDVSSMGEMFSECTALSGIPGINDWDVSTVKYMVMTFNNARLFNDPIHRWDVSNVVDMRGMFQSATSFNQPIGSWNVSSVTNMYYMFSSATSFNQPIHLWDVRNVTNMEGMFNNARSFNQVLADWQVGQVTNMSSMFSNAVMFNQPIGSWDVSNVTNMSYIFNQAGSFNQPLNTWNVGRVTNMALMFYLASSFNQPLNNWDTRQVSNMWNMFSSAQAFNQPLGDWELTSATNMIYTLSNSGMDCTNMALTLEGWAANTTTPNNILLGADEITYGLSAAHALQILRNTKGWTVIIGDGVECAALDVSLIHFDAKSENGIVKLSWSTASETDNDYFEVERSSEGRKWDTISRTKGAGTVNAVRDYSQIDSNPPGGISYYRLKIMDFSGKADYSYIRSVKVVESIAHFIYPNPAHSTITVSGKAQGHLKIYNVAGREVLHSEMKTEKQSIPVDKLPAGTYLIRMNDGWNTRLIKK